MVLDEQTDASTHGHTNNLKPTCPVNFFKVGGIIKSDKSYQGHRAKTLFAFRMTDMLKTVYTPKTMFLGGGGYNNLPLINLMKLSFSIILLQLLNDLYGKL